MNEISFTRFLILILATTIVTKVAYLPPLRTWPTLIMQRTRHIDEPATAHQI